MYWQGTPAIRLWGVRCGVDHRTEAREFLVSRRERPEAEWGEQVTDDEYHNR